MKENRRIAFISNLRLVFFLVGIVGALFYYLIKNYYLAVAVFLAFLLAFIMLVKMHNKAIEKRSYMTALHEINDKSIKRIEGEWKQFIDTGEEFVDAEHNYSKDLDIFGKGSLFQWINTTVTYLGRERLREIFEKPSKEISDIYERQEAVGELAEKLDFRQNFMAEGMIAAKEIHNPEELFLWANSRKKFYCNPLLNFIIYIWPLITVIAILLPFTTRTPYYMGALVICINIGILMWDNEDRSRVLGTVDKYKENIRTYYGMLQALEKEQFHSRYIKNIKSNLINDKGDTASEQIRKLSVIEEKVSGRRNVYYSIINILTLSDYRYMRVLEMWKKDSGECINKWLNTLGEIEALAGLSIIKYDNPEWVMPSFTENQSLLSAKEMGHPLLTGERVCNDLKMQKPSNILLITGSNMSGKSTLLRTAGINLVLAYAGAPVCAKEFSCSVMEIYTCMRVSDDLERSISSFYAEILRIKKIVEATKRDKQIFFLLDEIFKGTNSMDRHTGAKVLINRLSREGALGLVSTHDLELGELEEESQGKVKNYHFREYYKEDKIYFDYKLRSGISTTRNALYLIKMAGIEID
ncbi:DNA mismatch repair protein [Clostridium bovifaecis]|uniref:DNA mismatch repair protein n=1 Tax=Clostridium bovifaecis TaxID=2184719 RepID=A0A6I6EWP0_9CLOT|nr:DNA mismatch repair protein [Clostridium bovifaecis]